MKMHRQKNTHPQRLQMGVLIFDYCVSASSRARSKWRDLERFTIEGDGCAVAPANSRCMLPNGLPSPSF